MMRFWLKVLRSRWEALSPFKRVAALPLGVLIVSQFLGPARTNPPVEPARTLEAHLQVTAEMKSILRRACRNCHSHQTRWPWYSHVAPVSWFVIDHVNHGRREMNFSRWGEYDQEKMRDRLKEMCEMVEKGEMPLPPYLWMHKEARLTPEDVETICEWSRRERSRLLGQ